MIRDWNQLRESVCQDDFSNAWEVLLLLGNISPLEKYPVPRENWDYFIEKFNTFAKKVNTGQVRGPCKGIMFGFKPNRVIFNLGPIDIFIELKKYEVCELNGNEIQKIKFLWPECVARIYWTLFLPEVKRVLQTANGRGNVG